MMADLHEASADFLPNKEFNRPCWGSQSFRRDWEHLQQNHSHFISDKAVKLYAMAAAKVTNYLDTFEPT